MTAAVLFTPDDLPALLYTSGLAGLLSVLTALRARQRRAVPGLWWAALPDMLVGLISGTALALGLPERFPALNTPSGLALLAALGAVLGPQVWDLLARDGLRLALTAAATLASGPLAALAKAAARPADAPPSADPETPRGP